MQLSFLALKSNINIIQLVFLALSPKLGNLSCLFQNQLSVGKIVNLVEKPRD